MQRIILMRFDLDGNHFIPSDAQVATEIIDRVEKEEERFLEANQHIRCVLSHHQLLSEIPRLTWPWNLSQP